eukprot:1305947-Karenia_brevis.AAC.1
MCLMAGLGTPEGQGAGQPPPPPPPPAQLRATRPRRRGMSRLQPQDYHPGPQGLMSLREMLLMAGCEVSDEEDGEEIPSPPSEPPP